MPRVAYFCVKRVSAEPHGQTLFAKSNIYKRPAQNGLVCVYLIIDVILEIS